MNLVYIYGPPGVGKLTVATALAELTGYKLFHNHLSIAAVQPVFDFDTTPFWPLVHSIRLQVIEAAASHDVDIIFTNVYEHPTDLPRATARFQAVEGAGGRVCPVQLVCEGAVLEQRLQAESRVAWGKLSSVEMLREMMKRPEVLLTPIPGHDSLKIDNTNLTPETVARQIAAHYGFGSS